MALDPSTTVKKYTLSSFPPEVMSDRFRVYPKLLFLYHFIVPPGISKASPMMSPSPKVNDGVLGYVFVPLLTTSPLAPEYIPSFTGNES